MNRIRSVIHTSFRTYARAVRGSRGKRQNAAAEKEMDFDITEEEMENYMEFESDFMNVGQAYDEFKKEEKIAKKKLINRIVARKHFKEDRDPNFLTYTEKDEMRKLHKENPEEWTPERLSESFPALPGTIKKILKNKTSPFSVDSILNYDSEVIRNWKKFNAGKLPVSPVLKEHLLKFKGRKISLTNREVLAKKLIRPPPEFQKPKSKLFSNIITSYIEASKSDTSNQKMLPTKDNVGTNQIKLQSDHCTNDDKQYHMNNSKVESSEKENSLMGYEEDEEDTREENTSSLVKYENKNRYVHKKENLMTFNAFAKSKLENLYKTDPEEGVTLISVYKKYLNTYEQDKRETKEINEQLEKFDEGNPTQTLDAYDERKIRRSEIKKMKTSNLLKNMQSHVMKNENKSSDLDTTNNLESAVSTEVKTNASSVNVPEEKKTGMETYIKEWNTSIEKGEYFDDYIKIPKKLHKEGKLYRINDCYYDDDGEFLYRVPGLKN